VVIGGGLMHEAADGVVDQQVRPDSWATISGGAGAQHHLGAALVSLELIPGGLNLPSLVVQGGQFGRGRLGGVQDGGQQPVRGGLLVAG
jgi:hypothetical protein